MNFLSSFWVKLGLSIFLLAALFYETDLAQLGGVLVRAHPVWLVLALVGYMMSQAMSAVRWCLLARPVGFLEPFRRYFIYYFAGMYLNFFAPSTVAGDIGRALFLAKGKRRALALSTVLADRGIGFIALVLVCAGAIVLLPSFPLPRPLYWAAWLIPPATVVLWLWGPRLAVRVLSPTSRWRVMVEQDLAPYWSDRRVLGISFTIAVAFHFLQIATQIVLAWSLGLRVSWLYFLVMVPIVNIVGMLPITFNGVGIREAGYWYFLRAMGVDREAAVALGLISSAVVLVVGLTGAPMLPLANRKPISSMR